jgi:hypothetical protein
LKVFFVIVEFGHLIDALQHVADNFEPSVCEFGTFLSDGQHVGRDLFNQWDEPNQDGNPDQGRWFQGSVQEETHQDDRQGQSPNQMSFLSDFTQFLSIDGDQVVV